jgi:hypothetical protein
MAEKIDFAKSFSYDAAQNGINVPIEISLSGKVAAFDAKIDTGSTNCIFARKFGEEIGIEIENGLPKRIRTATGGFLTYEHEVTLSVLSYDFNVLVCFAADEEFQTSVLGRYGFLMQIKLGLIDYEGKVLISSYDE